MRQDDRRQDRERRAQTPDDERLNFEEMRDRKQTSGGGRAAGDHPAATCRSCRNLLSTPLARLPRSAPVRIMRPGCSSILDTTRTTSIDLQRADSSGELYSQSLNGTLVHPWILLEVGLGSPSESDRVAFDDCRQLP